MYSFLADLIVLVHFLYVGFAVGGEIIIILGGILKWRWIRNLPFRITHLTAVVIVAIEALIGVFCPLTVWEYSLRRLAGQTVEREISFIGRLVRSIIFYDFPAWVFTVTYVLFAGLILLTLFLVPPKRRR